MQSKRKAELRLGHLGLLLLLPCFRLLSLPPVPPPAVGSGDTWSVVAADVESGAVGVAGASCVPLAKDAIVALVPGKGAAAVQADFDVRNRDRVFEMLQAGSSAGEIIADVTSPAFDPRASLRQYGVVTVSKDPETAAYTGADTFPWAGDAQATPAVTVQGNFLESEAVAGDALVAFLETNGPLSERLMQALVAGSAAGGDRRCNRDGARQTAAAAFIVVGQAGEPPFAAPALGVTKVGERDSLWLYLSVVEPIGGDNAVLLLQEQYRMWAAGQLLPEAGEEAGDRPTRARPALLLLLAIALALFLRRLLLRSRQQAE